MLLCVAIGIVVGIGTGVGARRLGLWVYRRPGCPVVNVFAVFGLVMGLMLVAPCAFGADIQAKLEQLNAREKQLIEKLEAVRERERYVESQLKEVRGRKEALLKKQTGLPVHAPGVTPAPTAEP